VAVGVWEPSKVAGFGGVEVNVIDCAWAAV
jgi:hypothetical protein